MVFYNNKICSLRLFQCCLHFTLSGATCILLSLSSFIILQSLQHPIYLTSLVHAFPYSYCSFLPCWCSLLAFPLFYYCSCDHLFLSSLLTQHRLLTFPYFTTAVTICSFLPCWCNTICWHVLILLLQWPSVPLFPADASTICWHFLYFTAAVWPPVPVFSADSSTICWHYLLAQSAAVPTCSILPCWCSTICWHFLYFSTAAVTTGSLFPSWCQ